MNKTLSKIIYWGIPAGYLILSFLYIVFIIEPELIFHHVQPTFIVNTEFFRPFLRYPGGAAELTANLMMQSFYFKFAGPVVFYAIAILIGWLTYLLMQSVFKSGLNRIWALIPTILTIELANNYNFPFSVVISIAFLLSVLVLITKIGKGLISILLIYTIGAIAIYYFAGSGYLILFSISALFISPSLKRWAQAAYSIYIAAFAFLIPLLASNFLFAVSLKNQYLWFYPVKVWFRSYEPSGIFIFYLVSVPIILAVANVIAFLQNRKINLHPKSGRLISETTLAFFVVFAVAFHSHYETFSSDAKKIVEADFYCYHNQAEETAKAAATLKAYSFSANLNYNLVISKTDKITENFFGFFQIKGTEALYPDVEFASELSFIASDFYYDLGFISEARHWTYESLVFYPHSIRAMQNLVKIHLVTGEYKAAERTLNTLEKGLIGLQFVKEFRPYISDTSLIASNSELMEKRSFIPAERELNTSIEGRFRELLEANGSNKKAYEFLMLYYLLGNQPEKFTVLFNDCGKYFEKIPAVYEEALLVQAARTGQPLPADIKVSAETEKRYNSFIQKLEQYRGKTRMARNALYAEYGKTYLYFLQFVYPNIIEPEIIDNEDDYPSI
ncbi:MAG TPA: DUF6057 family protein [Draconibacterium sp.]|nr:DUF6057 family protein [Draconibacterium sp.]